MKKAGICDYPLFGGEPFAVTCVVLAQSLFCPWRGYLGPFLPIGASASPRPVCSGKDGVVMDPLSLVTFPQENERQSFWDLVEEEGYEALWPAVEPFFPLLVLVLGIFLIGFSSGLIPALQAYRTSLSDNLSPKS